MPQCKGDSRSFYKYAQLYRFTRKTSPTVTEAAPVVQGIHMHLA